MKTINKLVLAFFSFFVTLAYAGPVMPPPPGGDDDGGVVGPGAPSPIDMYIMVLIIVAVMLTIFFAKKYKIQKV